MPALGLLTDSTFALLAEIPMWMRDDPTAQAIMYSQAVELDVLQGRSDAVRDRLPAQADDFALRGWEALLQITVGGPAGATLDDRRAAVASEYAKIRSTARGADWVATLAARIGVGWNYVEHDHDDPTGPPPDTIWVFVPYAPDSSLYAALLVYIRAITSAKDEIVLISTGGFLLDESAMDVEGLGV